MSNKTDLCQLVKKKLDLSSDAEADRVSRAVIDGMKALIKKTKSFQWIGLGTFKVVSRKARMGVNPKTGERIKIKASKSVKFVPGKALKGGL